MKKLTIYLLLLLYSTASLAQDRYNNYWQLPDGRMVNFNNGTLQNSNTLLREKRFSTIISHPSTGMPLFSVAYKLGINTRWQETYFAFDHDQQPMPNANVTISFADLTYAQPIVLPHPTDTNLYYIITGFDKGLQYSIIDLRLRNGKGDINPQYKLIKIIPNGTLIGQRITTATSCDGVWLLVHQGDSNQILRIKIDKAGIHPPISQMASLAFTPRDYHTSGQLVGNMSSSSDGKLLAICSDKGVELFEIEPCSGLIKNGRLIDTTTSYSACFSPDNTKLYVTQHNNTNGYIDNTAIVQWDVTDPTLINIQQSKSIILINSIYYWPYSNIYTSGTMGDLRIGDDGKLYVLSNIQYLAFEPANIVPPYSSTIPYAQTLHVIHQPNALGSLCNAEREGHLLLGEYLSNTSIFLPHPVTRIPYANMDTIFQYKHAARCFDQPILLQIDSTATCIQWYNGDERISISTKDTGKLWVNYTIGCTPHSDTFIVATTTMPAIQDYILACRGQGALTLPKLDNHASYSFELKQQGRIIRSGNSDTTVVLRLLQAGSYQLHYRTGGCDTTIAIKIEDLPKPWITTIPTDSVAINYGDSVRLTASGAYLYTWSPTQHLDTTQGETVIASPHHPTRYEVVGFNEYGCMDTAYIKVNIDYGMEIFLPNAFTPNGDGLNDVFGLQGQKFQHLKGFYIYNRYGQEVYFSQDVNAGWDGTQNGQPCDVGVYYYMLEVVLPNGKAKAHKGEVHLIR